MMLAIPLAHLVAACGDANNGADRSRNGVDTGPEPVWPASALIIVVDGVRTDEFSRTEPSDLTGDPGTELAAQVWATIAPHGTVIRTLLNTGVTITAPAHAAMLIGRAEPYANFPMDDGVGTYRPVLPTLFEEATEQLALPEGQVVFMTNTALLEGLAHSLYPGAGDGAVWLDVPDPIEDGKGTTDAEVLDALQLRIQRDHPRLVVVNLHSVDRAGHYGEDGAYVTMVETVAQELAGFWNWLEREESSYADSLLLMITSDHGRHRPAGDDAWRNHGDSCSGCREVPFFLTGGGAEAGLELQGAYAHSDLMPTVAAHLGVTLPWAEGIPLSEAGNGFEGVIRSGEYNITAGGNVRAVQVWLDDREARSEVRVDDILVSTPGTMGAEAPVVVSSAIGDLVCFRELQQVRGDLPWVPRCLVRHDAGEWLDIGFPDPEVNPYWRAAAAVRNDTMWVAWADNSTGVADLHKGAVGISLAAWSAAKGWGSVLRLPAYFPTDATIAAVEGGVVVAFGTNDEEPDSRYTRHIRIVQYGVAAGVAEAASVTDLTLPDVVGLDGRVEFPALQARPGRLDLAFTAISDDAIAIMATNSVDGGATWAEPTRLPLAGAPLPHLSSAWDGPNVVWAVLADEGAILCRADPKSDAADCIPVGSDRLQSFAVNDGVATVVRDAGTASWETATLPW